MTPTLAGRWQTRAFLLVLVGIPVSLPFCLIAGLVPLGLLLCTGAIGALLDVYYDRVQRSRWDHDWPVHRQIRAGVLEFAALLFGLFGCCACSLPLGPAVLKLGPMAAIVVPVHWWSVWLISFLFVQGPMRALFPRWRFRGGRLL